MTRIKYKFGPAGTWGFHTALGSVTTHDRASHDKLIALTARIALMLEVRGLRRSLPGFASLGFS